MSRNIVLSEAIRQGQRRAADPAASIWVAANAGSGKTHVLTERVLRLLLSGVRPESILCLTYTKAAAAEMRERVAKRLAEWALADDADLAAKIAEVEGRAARPAELMRARTLFAHALETPGGLKIVTIHAFCESVLHRFPLEAGVPVDFTVVEEADRADMVQEARDSVLAEGLKGAPLVADAVAVLFERLSDFAITEAIDVALADSRKLKPLLGDAAGAKARLRRLIGFTDRTSAVLLDEIVAGRLVGASEIARLLAITPPTRGGKNFEDRLARIDPAMPSPRHLLKLFLTAEGCVPKNFPKKAVGAADQALSDLFLEEAQRLEGLYKELTAATLIERSEALIDVIRAIVARYEAEKRARSLLDFDDLVARLHALLRHEGLGPWVQYKLDAGIAHVLVDESQDTNPEQWGVVEDLVAEFFAGEGAIERVRTVFAVGDEKQSIYSFQGADPRLFEATGRKFAIRADAAGRDFDRVRLRTSFRTLKGVLDAVDLVFQRDDIREAVLAIPGEPVHKTARSDAGGTVTLWPPIREAEDNSDPNEWPLEAPKSDMHAPRQVAERIAGQIRSWIDSGRPLGTRGRAVTADDVLILVQSRHVLFHELIRALLLKGLPTPGADRLEVTGHIAVKDLIALGDVMLNPADNLQLAALLRSPLFDISEDDLFGLAAGRSGTLWEALAGSKLPQAEAAYRQLHRWRGRADFERPFEFFSRVLYAEGGLRRFHARLGREVDDVFAEFLDLTLNEEQSGQPSLQGLVAALRKRDVSIRRELAEAGGGVRVMTVHGAKGLEAPIVILADAASKPEPSQIGKPLYIAPTPRGPVLVHASARRDHVPATLALREADEANLRDEYWRKLYVGMTRAEDELYVTGTLTRTGSIESTWYEAIETALRPHADILTQNDIEVELTYPAGRTVLPATGAAAEAALRDAEPLVLPALPEHQDRLVVQPSAAHELANIDLSLGTALEAGVDRATARAEGTALHALLQHLGRIAPEQRTRVAEKALQALLPEHKDSHADMAAKAMRLLADPELAWLFAGNSRAEVPFLVNARRNGAPVRLAGRFDRLIVDANTVTVVDYKSDANPPETPEAVQNAYLMQLGLYALVAGQLFPQHSVKAAVLWTRLESLMFLPKSLLAEAVSAFTVE